MAGAFGTFGDSKVQENICYQKVQRKNQHKRRESYIKLCL